MKQLLDVLFYGHLLPHMSFEKKTDSSTFLCPRNLTNDGVTGTQQTKTIKSLILQK